MPTRETASAKTYLTFTLDQEDFAVDVAGVREVLDFTAVTRVPRTPEYMKGVINLRGNVVPVVDMRLKFGLPEGEKTVDTCIIVMEVEMEGAVTVIGAVADSVKEVFELEPDDIEPPPRLGTRLESEFVSGMGKRNGDFIIILDVNRIFSTEEVEYLRQAEESGSTNKGDGLPRVAPQQGNKGFAGVDRGVTEETSGGEEPADLPVGQDRTSPRGKTADVKADTRIPRGKKP